MNIFSIAPLSWEELDRFDPEGPLARPDEPRPSMQISGRVRSAARADLDRRVFGGETSLVGDRSPRTVEDVIDEDDRTVPSLERGPLGEWGSM